MTPPLVRPAACTACGRRPQPAAIWQAAWSRAARLGVPESLRRQPAPPAPPATPLLVCPSACAACGQPARHLGGEAPTAPVVVEDRGWVVAAQSLVAAQEAVLGWNPTPAPQRQPSQPARHLGGEAPVGWPLQCRKLSAMKQRHALSRPPVWRAAEVVYDVADQVHQVHALRLHNTAADRAANGVSERAVA